MDHCSFRGAYGPVLCTLSRRHFVMGSSAAIAGLLVGCGGESSSSQSSSNSSGLTLNTNIVTQSGPPVVRPSPQWNGVAGSGFANVPTDPQRTTAKPACRLLVPPRQRFSETLLVGVIAMANNGGTMFEAFGLEKVIVHYEGGRVELTEPTVEAFRDANGREVKYAGWWAKLGQSDAKGEGHLYFEAVPRDRAMQRRVIGPFSFFPSTSEYDLELEVAPTQAAIAGRRFQTCKDAVQYAYASGAQHPRILVSESAEYALDYWLNSVWINGWLTVEAAAGVQARFVQHGTPTEADTPRMSAGIRTRFRGEGIVIDFRATAELDAGANVDYWFDGCQITNSAGPDSLWRKMPRRLLAFTVRGQPWHTESRISNIFNPLDKVALARGVQVSDTREDFAQGAACLVGCTSLRHLNDSLRTYLPAIRIRYAGTASVATIESLSPGKTFVFKEDGQTVGIMPLTNTAEAYALSPENSPSGTYHVSNLAAWINASLPGWSAELHDDSRFGASLSLLDGRSAQIAPTAIGSDGLQLFTHFDIHGDFYQRPNDAEMENVVFYGNSAVGGSYATLFMGSARSGYLRDAFFVNNAWHHDPASPFHEGGRMDTFSGNASHVVIVHNSVVGQGIRIPDPAQSTIGTHNLLAANVAKHMQLGGAPVPQVEISDNHLEGGASAPQGANGTQIGGTTLTLFADAQNGDFRARGELLNTQAKSRLPFDLAGAIRPQMSPRGACL
ncbi:hypothetical protein [Erythrobacter sp. EC-HK427]|uniref:hypothetical protein n=1 Tax=Erythrobacter sp. EC-HK427 TaxID=2038396 RepID=UPI001257C597|nr:hypothetical protein [Erythrobacter sp. EC-HK427]VVT10977.1 conserved hypothetical protein [Erythrobacter sp. EC-HK427]